jgi:hypothetical protein
MENYHNAESSNEVSDGHAEGSPREDHGAVTNQELIARGGFGEVYKVNAPVFIDTLMS